MSKKHTQDRSYPFTSTLSFLLPREKLLNLPRKNFLLGLYPFCDESFLVLRTDIKTANKLSQHILLHCTKMKNLMFLCVWLGGGRAGVWLGVAFLCNSDGSERGVWPVPSLSPGVCPQGGDARLLLCTWPRGALGKLMMIPTQNNTP